MKKTILVALLFCLPSCSWVAQRDLKVLCRVATDFETSSQSGQAKLNTDFYEKVRQESYHPSFLKALDAIASAESSQRYALMQNAAGELGVDGFECEALEKLWQR